MGPLTVAVHQPNYLPWLGYFHKISQADIFVFLDNVQFERHGYTHRVRSLSSNNDLIWLTQNVKKTPREETLVSSVLFSDKHWVRKHLKTLEATYRKAPYYSEVFSLVEEGLLSRTEHLSLFNGELIRQICNALKITTKILYASELEIGRFTSASERIALITQCLGGTHYLSGNGARSYNDLQTFARYSVKLEYNNFSALPYPQRTSNFTSGLSVVDALFNLGFSDTSSYLEESTVTDRKRA